MRRHLIRVVIIFGLLAAFMPSLTLRSALAAGVVGNGNPVSCTEAAFEAALAGGGLVTFDCGLGQHTINLTTTKVIANNTQIDGGGLIFLDMNGNAPHFYVAPPATLRIENIRLEAGSSPGDGGILWNDGTVIATNVIFSGGFATDNGGAIRNDGTLVVTDGFFTANLADGVSGGGSIYNAATGTTSIMGDTTFIVGLADFGNGGAISNDGGTVNISGTALFENNVGDNGGAIANSAGGAVTIDGATFDDNSAVVNGGAIFNIDGSVAINHSLFVSNDAFNNGGAIYNGGNPFNSFSIANSDFQQNEAGFQGGAVHNESSGGMAITTTQFVSNSAVNSGGAINNVPPGFMTVTRSVLFSNTADFRGGGLRNAGNMTIETTTISGNSATNQGGGIVNQGLTTVNNSTIAFNDSGLAGGGIRNAAAGTLNIGNSIISDNSGGADCSDVGVFNSLDFNLDGDGSCPIAMANDISAGNANLQPIAQNEGPTLNHLPGFGSDAIDAGPGACASPDQRGQNRPQNGACDIGAVEVIPPADVCFNLWTKFLQQPTNGNCNGPYLQKVVFEDNGPHYLCAGFGTGILSYSYAPTCPPYGLPAISMPAAAPLSVCLNFYSKQYRIPPAGQPCSMGEFATVLQ